MKNKKPAPALDFFQVFAANPLSVGAIAPSSRKLAHAMIQDLRLDPGEGVLELGPGTGAITAQIQQILPEPEAYLGIERQPKFTLLLKRSFPDLAFITGSAEDSNTLSAQSNLPVIKVIVSSLPFANLSPSTQDQIISSIHTLMGPHVIFRTYQYLHAYHLPLAVRFRKQMNTLFGRFQRSKPLWSNLPPAYVLTWMPS